MILDSVESELVRHELDYADTVSDCMLDLADEALACVDLETCLRYLHVAATVLARQNRFLYSSRVERLTRDVAAQLFADTACTTVQERREGSRPTALHVLSEALPAGGLTAMATRWIANDSGTTSGYVALLSTEVPIPAALATAVSLANGSVLTPPFENSFVEQAKWLRGVARNLADYVVLHVDVSDVVCGAAFNFPGGPPVVLVNHTAHSFWTGISYVDKVANCRGSQLEQEWTINFRGSPRHCTIPIPLMSNESAGTARQIGGPRRLRSQCREELGLPVSSVVLVTVGAQFKYVPIGELDFLKVLSEVLNLNPNARLLVVGFDADKRWKEACEQSNGRILVLGRVSQTRLSEILAMSDIYVEGFPFGTTTALLEAALAGAAVVLAPSACPPPFSTDGVSIDGIVDQTSTVSHYIEHVTSLITDKVLREEAAGRIQASVSAHHLGPGWKAHLNASVNALPEAHAIYSFPERVSTPTLFHIYWARYAPLWSWPYIETLEHAIVRALDLDLQPRLSRDAYAELERATIRLGRNRVSLFSTAMMCNRVLPHLPASMRLKAFRVSSFLLRQGTVARSVSHLKRLLTGTARRGSYDEYRVSK